MAQTIKRAGGYRDGYDFWEWSSQNDQNIVVDRVRMGEDGWIVGIGAHASGHETTTPAELVLFDSESGALIHRSGTENWGSVLTHRRAGLDARPVEKGTELWVGVWGHPDYRRRFSTIRGTGQHRRTTDTAHEPPGSVSGLSIFENRLGAWVEYVPNERPRQGKWRSDQLEGISAPYSPVFKGTIDHSDSEGGRDRTVLVHVRVYDKNRDEIVFNQQFEPTGEEVANGEFARVLFEHRPGREYWTEYRHQDTWGLWSIMSARTHYEMRSGPYQPVLESPVDNAVVKTRTPVFSGLYDDPLGRASSKVQIRVHNANKSRVIRDSGWRNMSGSRFDKSFSSLDFNQLPLGQKFRWDARFQANDGDVGSYCHDEFFSTNSAPYAPTKLAPADGEPDGSGVLSFIARDPDGEELSWAKFKVTDLTTGSILFDGFQTNGPFGSGSRISHDFKEYLVLGHRYRWQAWVYDGMLESQRSGEETFLYDLVPLVSLLAPSGRLENLVNDPSVEYGGSGWQVEQGVNGFSAEIVTDGDAAKGEACFEATKAAGADAGGNVWTNGFPVDRTKPAFAAVALKRKNGVATSRVRVECLDSGGASVGFVAPDDLNGGLAGADPGAAWERYGGFVGPSEWPATTASARIVVTPSESSEAMVRVDDAAFFALPAGGNTSTALSWLGSFDGDEAGYGLVGDYYWSGEAGTSTSHGPNVLTEPAPSLVVSYSSPNNNAKNADRTFVERWDGAKWVSVLGSSSAGANAGWVQGGRTTITVPSGTFRNQGRYRIKVEARDSNLLIGSTGWVEVDTRLDGPPELNVLSVGADPRSATLSMTWQPSTLDELELARIEVAVESEEEGEMVVARLTDPAAVSYTYHFPASGRDYRLKVRQVQIIGAEEVAGPWGGGRAAADFFPYYFLKSVEDPTVFVVFEPLRGEIPGSEGVAPVDEYLPILVPGEGGPFGRAALSGVSPQTPSAPIHVVGPHRYETGSFTASLWDDPNLSATAHEQRERIRSLDLGSRFACFLGQVPPSKNFAVLKKVAYQTNDLVEPRIDIEWSDTRYLEDIYLREGAAP